MRRKLRAHWRLILLMVIVSGAGLVCGLILLFQHIPAWYRPVRIAPLEVQTVKDDLVRTFDGFTEALATASRPFEYKISEQQVNAWLATREEIWPLSREWLLPGLSDPMIQIEDNGVRLAATYREGGLKTVASVRFHIEGDANGILVRLAEMAGGSLPVPTSWARDELAKLDRGIWPAGKIARHQYAGPPLPALTDLFEAAVFPNAWVWQNGKIPFRISRLAAERGWLVLTIEPLPRQVETRRSTQPS